MKIFANILAGVLTAIFLIQPCPAPFASVSGMNDMLNQQQQAAQMQQALQAAQAQAGMNAGGSGGKIGKRDTQAPPECVRDMKRAVRALRFEQYLADDLLIQDVPQSCAKFVQQWNSHSNIAALNRAYGKMRWIDGMNAIQVTDIPTHMQPNLKRFMTVIRTSQKFSRPKQNQGN